MTDNVTQTVTISAGPKHTNGTRLVIAMTGTQELRRDEINTDREKARQQYAAALAQRLGQTSRVPEFVEGILRAADDADNTAQACEDATADDEHDDRSHSAILIDLAAGAQLFHTPDGVAYATITVGEHTETWPLVSREFRSWLSHRFFEERAGAPGSQPLHEAIATLEARALFGAPEIMVHTRLAEHDGDLFLDLADVQWTVVHITAGGWETVNDAPVKFRRRRGMQPLPHPERGGSLRDVDRFLNVTPEDRPLLLGWLLAAARPVGPYPVLFLTGEHGTAKSTVARVLRRLVDPNKADLRGEPRKISDLVIAAENSRLVALDNISHITAELSDALCRLATGGGFGTRELYSDGDEFLVDVQRPVVITGIGELVTRGDLLDRSMVVNLLPIAPNHRRTEHQFWREFNAAHSRLLGALLDGIVVAMRNLPEVSLPELPRMADFATWAVAAESSMAVPPGTFLARYDAVQDSANELAIQASAVGTAIRTFMAGRPRWEGTATRLWEDLLPPMNSRWPANPQRLAIALRQLAPNLRNVGIDVQFGRGQQRIITIRVTSGLLAAEETASPTFPDQRRVAAGIVTRTPPQLNGTHGG